MTISQTSGLGRLSPVLVAKAIGALLSLALAANSVVKLQKEQGEWLAWAMSAAAAAFVTSSIGDCADPLVPKTLGSFLKKKSISFYLNRDFADELDSDYLRQKLAVALRAVSVRDVDAVEAVLVAVKLLDCTETSKFYVAKTWAVLVNFDASSSPDEGLLVQIVRRVRQ